MGFLRLRATGWKIALMVVLTVLISLSLFLRGSYVSGLLKAAILPDIEAATGCSAAIRKIVINLFPPYFEARGLRLSDGHGHEVFAAGRVKVYPGLSGILNGRIGVRRIVVVGPIAQIDKARIGEVLESVNNYLRKSRGGEGKFISLDTETVTLRDGTFSFHEESSGYTLVARGSDAEILVREKPEVRFSIREFSPAFRGLPELKVAVKGTAVLAGRRVEFKGIRISSLGSDLRGSGSLVGGKRADFSLEATLLARSLKELFGLKRSGDGILNISGGVMLDRGAKDVVVDLDLSGFFHLESLMELVNRESGHDLTGLISLKGRLKGSLSDLAGNAAARIEKGSFFGVKVDEAVCNVTYGDNRLAFRGCDAELYGGQAKADVSIGIPVVRPYSVDVQFENVDYAPVFELISIPWLKLPYGKMDGLLYSSGMDFEPEGWGVYRALKTGDDVMGRVRALKTAKTDVMGRVKAMRGYYRLTEGILNLSNFMLNTGQSRMYFDGRLDLSERTMNFQGRLNTDDINDLASPYLKGLKGRGEARAVVTGALDDPLIETKLRISMASFRGCGIGNLDGEVSYRKNLLDIKSARADDGHMRQIASGLVGFPDAQWLLDVKKPVYDVSFSVKGGDAGELARLLGLDVPLEGVFNLSMDMRGERPLPGFYGHGEVLSARVYGRPVSYSSFDFSYDNSELTLSEAMVREGDSAVRLEGRVSRKGAFDFRVLSDKVMLRDLFPGKLPVDYAMRVDIEGSGTFDKPGIEAELWLTEGLFWGNAMGGGRVNASLRGRKLLLEAALVNGDLILKGRAALRDKMPWSADIEIGHGRYDFLPGAFLRNIPEDLLFSMSGSAGLKGDRESFSASVLLSRLNLNLFGQGFTSKSDVVLTVKKGRVSLSEVELRSGGAFLKFGGNVVLGSSYDITVEGNSSLAPLKGLFDRVESIGGNADFVLALSGGWSAPRLNGGLTVSNGVLALKGFPQRLGSINGYIYADGDRIVIERLGGRLGGGELSATGVAHLDGLKVKKFYVDSLVENVSLAISRDFNMNIEGNLLFRGAAGSQDIAGEIRINRATYMERIEWKSWLLSGKEKAPKAAEEWVDRVGLNVRIHGHERISVDNNIARAPLKVDVVLGGTLGYPRLYGRIESREGKVYFRNSEFLILHATVDYVEIDPGSTGPLIRILAETSIGGYHIWLNLDGRVEQLDLNLSSDPRLDEMEILGLLALGEFGQNLSSIEGGIGAAEATSFLTGKFQDMVEKNFRDITGLDRFQIDPYVSKSTGNITPRITVSKRLLGERLFVTYASALGVTNEQAIKIEYLLGETISLLGGQDERGSIGGDLIFKFHFK